jgi:ADP-ribose pyrophosphatase YjhB (NUDIX family)
MSQDPTPANSPAKTIEPPWLVWARELQAIAQTGLSFTRNPYDRDRYTRVQALAADMIARHAGLDRRPIELMFSAQSGYATPKVDVRGAVFCRGQLLLVREKADNDRWTLPGGWADVNESPTDAVVKEVREEAGLEVRPYKLAAVWDRARHPHQPRYLFHIWKLFFLCEVIGGQARIGEETTEVRFFAKDGLPAELSVSRVLHAQLRRMFRHLEQPGLPTDFD